MKGNKDVLLSKTSRRMSWNMWCLYHCSNIPKILLEEKHKELAEIASFMDLSEDRGKCTHTINCLTKQYERFGDVDVAIDMVKILKPWKEGIYKEV